MRRGDPRGTWTVHQDLADLTGFSAQSVGSRLSSGPVPGAHRVLRADGLISPDFRWLDRDRTAGPPGPAYHLVHARGATDERVHPIARSPVTVHVHTLDLDRPPAALLAQVHALAAAVTGPR